MKAQPQVNLKETKKPRRVEKKGVKSVEMQVLNL